MVGKRLTAMNEIDEKGKSVGEWLTNKVGTMWCAGVFALIAFAGLPKAITEKNYVDWFIQNFLQLVLMSVILVGQDVQSKKTEKLIKETHRASVDEFEIAKRNQELASKELEELRLISADIHRIISELEARQSLKAISLESGRAPAPHSSPEQNIPMG
jgi:hypothetical protein